MRKDMAKVIVERPRFGHRDKRRKGRDRALEGDDGTPLRARAPRSDRLGKTKSLNENLAPLRRYLEAQVNRPWRKVWSEISENLKPVSTVQQHVRDHVPDFVAIDTRVEDGVVMIHGRWGRPVALKDSWTRLYVDPCTGILRRNPHWRSWSKRRAVHLAGLAVERKKRMRVVDKWTQHHLLNDGAWWEVTLAHAAAERAGEFDERYARHVEARSENDGADVVLSAGLSRLGRAPLYGRYGVMAVAKRQLSKKEMKRLRLR